MIDYTNALEERLAGRETEFAAAMTTTQTNVMDEMKATWDQQQKFMEMMITKLASGGDNNGNNNGGQGGANGGERDNHKYPECKHCGKRGIHALKPETCRTCLAKKNGGVWEILDRR